MKFAFLAKFSQVSLKRTKQQKKKRTQKDKSRKLKTEIEFNEKRKQEYVEEITHFRFGGQVLGGFTCTGS